jgi:uncharacterized protein (DUF1330 family)
MKSNRALFVTIVILSFAVVGISIYCIHQNDNAIATINRLESEKAGLSRKLDSLQVNLKTKNMAAYVIFIKEKTVNQEELKIYAKEAPAGLVGHHIITRAAYGKNQVIEGADVEGVAILEFPSFEEAKVWYENPIYQKAKEHRLKGGVYRAIIVDGINKQ